MLVGQRHAFTDDGYQKHMYAHEYTWCHSVAQIPTGYTDSRDPVTTTVDIQIINAITRE